MLVAKVWGWVEMATRKTAILLTDRSRLIEMLRPFADNAAERCNLAQLAGVAMGEIEAQIRDSGDPDDHEWLDRTALAALVDRASAELDLMMKATSIEVTLPFMKHPISINPRQGVRLKGMKEYQQIRLLSFTWDEYEAWREDWLARFERTGEIRAIISLIDQVRLTNPNVANIGAALAIGGAKVEAIIEEADAA